MSVNRVIWDFNGTILDDLRISIDSADELLSRYGLQKIETLEKYYSVFGFPIKDYYERIGFDFTKYDYSILANEWVEIYLSKLSAASLRSGVKETAEKLKAAGIKQTILSMTKEDMLFSQVASLGIDDLFDEILGLNDIYAVSKLELARNWRASHPNDNVIYVGDTVHDAESASVIGCRCLLIEGGHQSADTLSMLGYPIIKTPNEILNYI